MTHRIMLTLTALPDTLAITQLSNDATIPAWADGDGFVSITRAADELSIVCAEARVPADIKAERGWRAFKLQGPFDFALVGVLKQVLDPLAEAKVGIFAISTYNTDYVLVKAAQFEQAVTALTRFGHTVRTQAAETIDVRCGWRLPDGSRVTAAYRAEVIEYDAKQDRWLVKLAGVQTSGEMDATTRALIESQVGKWAYVPSEARHGLTLPLKYETLTGKPRWFHPDDPRQR
jgi:hypothetical protein